MQRAAGGSYSKRGAPVSKTADGAVNTESYSRSQSKKKPAGGAGAKGLADADSGSESKSKSPGFQRNRVAVRFQLNITQAVTTDTGASFSAFVVAQDGHCLFRSFQMYLGLADSVAGLRRSVVENIQQNTDAHTRLVMINDNIMREQDADVNPSWTGNALFDPDHAWDAIDDLRDHFTAVYTLYREEMLENSWAGETELMVLAQLQSVNAVVWLIDNGMATYTMQYVNAAAPPGSRTVHLHYRTGNHYQFTDVPWTFLPPSASPQEYRRSARPRRARAPSP
jgi:hypothetical protein